MKKGGVVRKYVLKFRIPSFVPKFGNFVKEEIRMQTAEFPFNARMSSKFLVGCAFSGMMIGGYLLPSMYSEYTVYDQHERKTSIMFRMLCGGCLGCLTSIFLPVVPFVLPLYPMYKVIEITTRKKKYFK
jgi:hypothetical protein